MLIKYSVRFFLRRRSTTTDNKPIRLNCRITLKSERPFDIPTNSSLLPSQYDATSQMVIGETRECEYARRTINEWRGMVADILNRYELIERRIPSADEVRMLLLDHLGRVSIDNLCDKPLAEKFEEYLSETEKRRGIRNGTALHMRTSINRLLAVTGNIDVSEVKLSHIEKMNAGLMDRGLKNTTIQKNEQMLRQFFKWASKKGYCSYEWLADYKPRYKTTTGDKEIVYLNRHELRSLESADLDVLLESDRNENDDAEVWAFSSGQLERCRDVFLFCCYTSLRYSDVYNLKKQDIVGNVMHIVTQKTYDALHIELNRKARAILDKYAEFDLPDGRALPVVSAQVTNRMLKRIAKLVGLTRPIHRVYYVGGKRIDEHAPLCDIISTHCARRTFVVMALTLGIPPNVIMQWTGHSSYNAMKPYIAIVDELKKESMKKFDRL